MNKSLLSLLSAEHPVSGEELAQHFACSRAAISKQIDVLKQSGVLISAKPKVGYQYDYDYHWWKPESLKQAAANLALDVTVLDAVASTNTWLRDQAASIKPHLAITDWQASGRGRRERQWFSPPGRQLTFSLRQDSQQGPWHWRGLALAVGVVLAERFNRNGIPVRLKWPNDLWLHDAKLGGILVELNGASDGPSAVIIGVGINEFITQDEKLALDRDVSDLSAYADTYERTALLIDLMEGLVDLLAHFPGRGLTPYITSWSDYDALHEKPVCFEQHGKHYEGVAVGVTSDGNLQVRTVEGLIACQASEVSIQGKMSNRS